MSAGKLFLQPIGQGHELVGLTTSGLYPEIDAEREFRRLARVRDRARLLVRVHGMRCVRAERAFLAYVHEPTEELRRGWQRQCAKSARALLRHSLLMFKLTRGAR